MGIGTKWLGLLPVMLLFASCGEATPSLTVIPTQPASSGPESLSDKLSTDERLSRLEAGFDARVMEFNIVQSAVYQMMIDNKWRSIPGSEWPSTNNMRLFPNPEHPLYGYLPFETTVWFYQTSNNGIIRQRLNPELIGTPPPSPEEARQEAQRAEFSSIQAAVQSLLIDNELVGLPHPVSANSPPCAIGTQDMRAFPDTGSVAGSADKLEDSAGNAFTASDAGGWFLWGVDVTGNSDTTATVNYTNLNITRFCYAVDGSGEINQYDTDGNLLTPSRK